MKKNAKCLLSGTSLTLAALLLSGCAAFKASTREVSVEDTIHYDSEFDHSDMRAITQSTVDDLLVSPFLVDQEEPPVMMIAGVQNATSEHVDTKLITDSMRTMLFKANAVRFVNDTRRDDLLREQGYQAGHATPETQVLVGRQLGARYMLSGTLAEMSNRTPKQVRVSRQQLNYYKLTMEVTDLESSELVWTTEKEFAREASKPLFGW